ncbi:hypothetical protein TNIN_31951 [Trichonephila inaurata madagascariensis]|uniref:Uncharacterized protein n=1 Tax=Trichonephila inaurata madagascariensis TaxID=2747483 RepID=A0A8X7BPL4_9ARAC|nr:hypothetical protein TNIN_31951 [Trichonephila inaurata madagascariensis]
MQPSAIRLQGKTIYEKGGISNDLEPFDFTVNSYETSTPLLPNSLVGVSETVVFDDGSSSLAEDIPSTSNSTALLPNTPIDVSESEDRESRNISFDNKRNCFCCGRDRKQIKEDLKTLKENDLIDKVAFILLSTTLKMDKTTLPAVMKMEDLINGECTIPEKLDRLFKTLIGGKDIRRRDGVNCHRLSN